MSDNSEHVIVIKYRNSSHEMTHTSITKVIILKISVTAVK